MSYYKYQLVSKLLFVDLTKKPGARVLYLGAASGTTVSHVSDVVGPVSTFLFAYKRLSLVYGLIGFFFP